MGFSRQDTGVGSYSPSPGNVPDTRIEPGSPVFQETLYLLSYQSYEWAYSPHKEAPKRSKKIHNVRILWEVGSPQSRRGILLKLSQADLVLAPSSTITNTFLLFFTAGWYSIKLVAIVLVSQSCLTLCKPTECRLLGSSVHGILQTRILKQIAIPFSRGPSWPRDWTQVICIAGRFFTIWATWIPLD